jgi:hypothetical protein
MNSQTLPRFWDAYGSLRQDLRAATRKAFILWKANPFYPSLHFKRHKRDGNVWSIRITKGYRVLGYLEGDTVTWFWVGRHDEYDRLSS